MKYNCHNLDEIQVQLRQAIADTEARIAAWEAVSFPTKKDGTPFKQMSKNISGANYYRETWALQLGEYRLRVTAHSSGSGYISSEMDAYCLVKYLTDEGKKAKLQNYQPKQAYLEQVYTYDLDDIKSAVADKVAQLKSYLAELNSALESAPSAYREFRDAYRAAVERLDASATKGNTRALYYMVVDTVTSRYPHC